MVWQCQKCQKLTPSQRIFGIIYGSHVLVFIVYKKRQFAPVCTDKKGKQGKNKGKNKEIFLILNF